MTSHIRLAGAADADAIASVLRDAFEAFRPLYTEAGFAATVVTPAAALARMSEGPVWVVERHASLVGTVAAVCKPEALYVRGMAVVPSARGLGIARLLLSHVERFARTRDLARAFLSTTPFLHDAIRLYERAGYALVEQSEHDLFGTPLVTMEKRLFGPTRNLRSAA